MKNYFLSNIFMFCLILTGFRCARHSEKLISKRAVSFQGLISDYSKFLDLVKPIAVKRVSGTPENQQVRDYITSKMQSYGWETELDTFQDRTPLGLKSFSNIIATYSVGKFMRNINRVQNKSSHFALNNRVVFACHYDSKYFKDFNFIAATDSAVPCAMLLDLAQYLKENFAKSEFDTLGRHLQFIFFDGEEAFVDWTETDSIYGSRNYAKVLKASYQQASFDSMDLFVLLDLIGAEVSSFPNYFPRETGGVYKIMSQIENILIQKKMLNRKLSFYFTDLKGFGQYRLVEDDHKPFLREGVPILHLIPNPFPSQWHNSRDNLENLSQNNIQDLRMILKYFLLTILNTENTAKKIVNDEF